MGLMSFLVSSEGSVYIDLLKSRLLPEATIIVTMSGEETHHPLVISD